MTDQTPAGGQPDPSTGVTDSQLAVLLRQTQWALDEAAHNLPAGRSSPRQREELAATLEALAEIIRASVPDLGPIGPEIHNAGPDVSLPPATTEP